MCSQTALDTEGMLSSLLGLFSTRVISGKSVMCCKPKENLNSSVWTFSFQIIFHPTQFSSSVIPTSRSEADLTENIPLLEPTTQTDPSPSLRRQLSHQQASKEEKVGRSEKIVPISKHSRLTCSHVLFSAYPLQRSSGLLCASEQNPQAIYPSRTRLFLRSLCSTINPVLAIQRPCHI